MSDASGAGVACSVDLCSMQYATTVLSSMHCALCITTYALPVMYCMYLMYVKVKAYQVRMRWRKHTRARAARAAVQECTRYRYRYLACSAHRYDTVQAVVSATVVHAQPEIFLACVS